jgi:CheY-like chemotaxis protein
VKLGTVLSVDDNEDDQLLLKLAWKKSAVPLALQMVCDGEKAIDYLSGLENYGDRERFPMPHFILLDLKMPRKNGFEVLDWINLGLPTERVPIAVFTSSQDRSDIKRAYDLGAKWYLAKPVDHAELIQLVQLIGRWFQNSRENDLSSSLHYRGPNSSQTD